MTDLTPDDQVIYRFLLDKLSAAEREVFEERLFREPEFFEIVEATEEELILRHVRGELDEPWASWFGPVYLDNQTRRARVEEARVLFELAKPRKGGGRRNRRAANAAIAGGLIAASAAGVGIFRTYDRQRNEAAVYQLDPGTLRGEAGTSPLRIRRGATLLRLELKIPAGAAGGKYEAVLSTPETPGLWKGFVETDSAGGRTPVDIPVSGLRAGDYILKLRGGGETAASYQFRLAP